jgi:hypothetical protein
MLSVCGRLATRAVSFVARPAQNPRSTGADWELRAGVNLSVQLTETVPVSGARDTNLAQAATRQRSSSAPAAPLTTGLRTLPTSSIDTSKRIAPKPTELASLARLWQALNCGNTRVNAWCTTERGSDPRTEKSSRDSSVATLCAEMRGAVGAAAGGFRESYKGPA